MIDTAEENRMALLPVITAPDPRLKRTAAPVARVDDAVRRLMDDMVDTMHEAPGVGLAAPQVGVLKRVIVVDATPRDQDQEPRPYRLVNPEIVWVSDEQVMAEEGCLSLPDQFVELRRPGEVKLRHLDADGVEQELDAEGLLARCILHEMDHLEGILFVDHLSAVRRSIILRRLVKLRKARALKSA
jgi:peptide deformylase